ncbi:WD repeat-containing protein 61 [Camelus ferus]|nr:WD repeat-containing protein 61 [Camelus ferus]
MGCGQFLAFPPLMWISQGPGLGPGPSLQDPFVLRLATLAFTDPMLPAPPKPLTRIPVRSISAELCYFCLEARQRLSLPGALLAWPHALRQAEFMLEEWRVLCQSANANNAQKVMVWVPATAEFYVLLGLSSPCPFASTGVCSTPWRRSDDRGRCGRRRRPGNRRDAPPLRELIARRQGRAESGVRRAAGLCSRAVRRRDEKLDLQWSLEGHQLGVVSVDISHTLPIAASSSLDAHIRLWDLENGKQIKSIDAGPGHSVVIVVLGTPQLKKRVLDGSKEKDGVLDAWTLAFSPDSQYLATGTHVGKVNIFGVESGKKEYSLDTRGKFILSIAYSPDGKYLASGAIDGIINIFDIATGKLLHTLEGHAMPIRSLTFSPDSQLLVTASDDGYIKIYDV